MSPLLPIFLNALKKSASVAPGFLFVQFIISARIGSPTFLIAAAGVAFNLACAANLASFVNFLSASISFLGNLS